VPATLCLNRSIFDALVQVRLNHFLTERLMVLLGVMLPKLKAMITVTQRSFAIDSKESTALRLPRRSEDRAKTECLQTPIRFYTG